MTISFNKRLQLKRARTYNKYSFGVRQKLEAPLTTTYGINDEDRFGSASAISDNYAIVGAPLEDDASGVQSGKAYIYSTTTGALLHTLNNPNPVGTSANDYFGFSVGISDNYAIVGAYQEDDTNTNSGKAYIYSTSTGALLYTLTNPSPYGTSAADYFGQSVAISGSYAIVGAYGEDDATGGASGKAYIYSTSTGALLYTLNNPSPIGTTASDYFGSSVGISETHAIVGAYLEDDAVGVESGKAYIYSTTTGALLYTLDDPNAYGTSDSDYFGYSVAISASHAIVGAYTEDDASGTGSGKAYIYSTSTGGLLYTLNNPNPYGTSLSDYFGYDVSISGSYAIVGAYVEDEAGGSSSGKAYIYSTSTGALLYTLNNPTAYGSVSGDQFGYSVGISNNYAIVGAYTEDDSQGLNAGKAYIYPTSTGVLSYTLNDPTVTVYPPIEFGTSVSTSPDGNYTIVGAPKAYTTEGNALAGKAYIYSNVTGTLLYEFYNPNAYSTNYGDYFGYSVSISNNYAIVGAYGEDDVGGTDSGKAYIYSTSTGALLHTLNNPNAYSTSSSDAFGYSVAITDSYAIVGAYSEDDAGSGSGKAYIFSTTTGALLYTLDNPNAYDTSAGDAFGYSVGISNNYAIVGAYLEDDATGSASGKAYIYSTSTGALLYTLNNPSPIGTPANDYFGYSVDISDSQAIVGAYSEDDAYTNSGKAYIYSTTTGALLYTLDNPNAFGAGTTDYFGWSVGISDSYAIVGAHLEDDATGLSTGKAYIYSLSTGTLLYTASNQNAYSVSENDWFGYSVAISDTYAVFGAPYETDSVLTAANRGIVYVFGYPSSSWV